MKHLLKNHILNIYIVALVARFMAAYFAYGALSLDDYKHGLIPAFQWAENLSIELPTYRSPLLIIVLGPLFSLAKVLSFDAVVEQTRFVYFLLGLLSLVTVYATQRFFEKHAPLYKLKAMLMVSFMAMMPFISTRSFGETLCIPFIALGMSYFHIESKRDLTLSFFWIGIATLFRFQVGVIWSLLALYVIIQKPKAFFRILGVGVILLVFQTLIDLSFDRYPLQTLVDYLKVNEGGATSYGVSPWYSTWLLAFAPMAGPFLLLATKDILSFLKKHKALFISVVGFILIHSLVPHKEERFLFPIFFFLLWILASIEFSKNFKTKTYALILWLIHLPLFIISTLSNPQASELAILEDLQKYESSTIFSYDSVMEKSRIKNYYLRGKINFLSASQNHTLQAKDCTPCAIISSHKDLLQLNDSLQRHLSCEDIKKAQSLSDYLLYSINPKRNKKRAPSFYRLCFQN